MSRACARRRARRSSRTIPEKSDILVEHLEAEGGIVYAMSNTPEFGAGANTFNEVFGTTRNPWNTSRSAAGSSGGAAVALATGMAWLAHGSDMGGSLRNPASFCGIVGFRPSVGRVAHTPEGAVDQNLGQQGPMARNVEDVALLLDAMVRRGSARSVVAAAHRRTPIWRRRARTGGRSASRGRPISASPRSIPKSRRSPPRRRERFAELGATVEEAHPDLSGLHECFQTLRAYDFFMQQGRSCCASTATSSSPR